MTLEYLREEVLTVALSSIIAFAGLVIVACSHRATVVIPSCHSWRTIAAYFDITTTLTLKVKVSALIHSLNF